MQMTLTRGVALSSALLAALIITASLASANLIAWTYRIAVFRGFDGKKNMRGFACLGAVLCVAMLLLGCGPTYPNGVIKNRDDAINAWRRQCAHEKADQHDGSLVATLHNGEWAVGFHDESAIVMAVFDAKSGKMKRCYYGARN
jgi:hypothetical protein